MARYKTFMTVYAEPETIDKFRTIMRRERAKGRLSYVVLREMLDLYEQSGGAA